MGGERGEVPDISRSDETVSQKRDANTPSTEGGVIPRFQAGEFGSALFPRQGFAHNVLETS